MIWDFVCLSFMTIKKTNAESGNIFKKKMILMQLHKKSSNRTNAWTNCRGTKQGLRPGSPWRG
jgi:hypothetical protein